MAELENEEYETAKTRFEEFLQSDREGEYLDKVAQLVENNNKRYYLYDDSGSNGENDGTKQISNRLLIDLDHLRNYDLDLATRVLQKPILYIRAFEDGLKLVIEKNHGASSIHNEQVSRSRFSLKPYKIGFIGSFGANLVSPRGLLSHLLTNLLCVEGIVTKMTLVKPKLQKSVHYCPKTGVTSERVYRDATSLEGMPTPTIIPTKDDDHNLLELEFGLSSYIDSQKVTIQEMPERAPLGQLPRSVDILLDDDLVDKVKPGDRVRIAGVYRAVGQGGASGFTTFVIASSIQTIGKDYNGIIITSEDISNIRTVADDPRPAFDRLSRSLAPSIYGHSFIKKAVLLMLLGGKEKNLANGTHLRGDINILMVGDPSTAKSQMLRFVLGTAPLAVSTTGRGSTGVGLTAAVTVDPDTNERRLEAGAMVLADRGVVCIDEFDKMSDADRVAIHEVMEQQTVTITKAGIHASLNARCSVIAAANPIYGQYDKDLSPFKNINLPDSLLSRFDVLFIVLDNLNPGHDRAISEHVLRMHRYQVPGSEGIPIPLNQTGGVFNHTSNSSSDERSGGDGERDEGTTPVYQKFNPLLHAGFAAEIEDSLSKSSSTTSNTTHANSKAREDLFSPQFIRKYVHYARWYASKYDFPKLTEESALLLQQEWTMIRQEPNTKTLPVTPRQLETLIRLATAHAKSRLSEFIEEQDCKAAIAVLRFALYNDAGEKKSTEASNDEPLTQQKLRNQNNATSSDSEEEDFDDENIDNNNKRNGKRNRKNNTTTNNNNNNNDTENENDDEEGNVKKFKGDDNTSDPILTVDENTHRFTRFQLALSQLFKTRRVDQLLFDDVLETVNSHLKVEKEADETNTERPYSKQESQLILELLEAKNRIMYRDNEIFMI